ncbi:molybdopterin-dependent oxidoreductase [Cellulomonas sp. zg-ZUI188]|uniref:Molybdopterin-dependent oxidoreductase n=2 Tax=Cellulomonas fengjieae TaxID=2819978 RepID=A0ABS3SDG4_9CELL|nr:molybdopterin-dependent oxidoreductase [Cellulomonas fengjieae]QVI67940.1 molybdopterin-dependent oxidoreductase [Cellulomonas fengjieae]
MAGRRDGLAALAGIAAGAVTVGVGALVALVAGPTSDPLVAVGSAFVDATPGWLKDVAVSTFGTADKVVLGIGEAVVLLALAALAGVLAARRWAWGATLVVVLGAVAGLAAMGRPEAGILAPAPAIAGAIAGLLVLRELIRRLPAAEPRDEGVQRRTFLQAALAAGALGVVAVVVGRAIGAGARGAQAARTALRIPRATTTAAPVPAGVQVGVDGVGPWQTPAAEFYRIDTALVVPQVDPSTWSLRVHGMVEQEITLTWDELLAGDLVEAWVTLACVSNPVGGDLIGNQLWLGLPIADLLARARPTGDADMVLSRSVDGFTASTPLEALTDGRDALLAIAMDGEPLPLEHGFPVRMVVPGLYGYVSATKWVTDLEVTRFADATSYWTDRGWSPEGPVKTQSRIEVPRHGSSVPAGSVVVAGTAWAQHRGVTGVQVRVDEGSWNDATLADDGGIDTWRQWSWTWDAEPGSYLLYVRASDPQGPQTGAVADVVPDGATGYDSVRVTVT